jgi:hypothetical protein
VKRVRRLVAVAAPAAVLTLGIASAATAHTNYPTLASSRGYGGVNSNHFQVRACDSKADGWGVRTFYEYYDSSRNVFVSGTVGDSNGSESGCGKRDTPYPVTWFNVCAGPDGANVSCTGGRSA